MDKPAGQRTNEGASGRPSSGPPDWAVARARELREQREAEERARQRRRRLIGGAVTLALAGLFIYEVIDSRESPSASPPSSATVTAPATPTAAPPIPATHETASLRLGNGPVTVELFEDFLCIYCRYFAEDAGDEIERLVREGRITLVVYPVAILDRASTNSYSTRAAASASCAADEGRLLEYSDALYAAQPSSGGAGLSNEKLIEIGSSVGLGETFAQCVREGRYIDWVATVTREMELRGVGGTPTVLVNGTIVERPDGNTLVAAVDAAATAAP